MQQRTKTAIRAWAREHGLDDATQRLINLANADLWHGPIGDTDEDGKPWPGFSKACELIRAALPSVELWIHSETDCVSDTEPDWWYPGCDHDGELEYPEDWLHLAASDLKCAIVGKELLDYVV